MTTLAWNAAWLEKYPQANLADPTSDDDGDGISAYQEMLAGTDPGEKPESDGPVPVLHEALDMQTPGQIGKNLREIAADAVASREQRQRELLDRAEQFDVPVTRAPDGTIKQPFAIAEDGSVFLGVPLDAVAADTVGADEVWPSGLWQTGGPTLPNFAHGSTGLALSGSGQFVGMWEDWADLEFGGTIAGIDKDHVLLLGISNNQFISRMFQGEEDPALNVTTGIPFDVPDSNHATQVAGVLGGLGFSVGTISDGTNTYDIGQQARGIAYNSVVLAYERGGFDIEFPTLADPTSTAPVNGGLRLANNSRGIASGWLGQNSGGQWIWWGNPDALAVEDWRFGAYIGSLSGYDYFPRNLDLMSEAAPYSLQVWGAGNFREGGPGVAPTGSYILGQSGQSSNLTRDWTNGDASGYDSLAPSAAAKNILTVGSCMDVVNGHLSTAPEPTYSSFSSAGPTDDGRIKPEIVAPGELTNTQRTPAGGGFTTPNVDSGYQFGPFALNSSGQSLGNTGALRGTSLSTPVVTGGLSLITERRAQLRPAWVAPSFQWQLQSSTLRMLAVHTARDLGAPGPDYRGGYGLFNVPAAVDAMGTDAATDFKPLIKEMLIGSGQFVQFQVTATSASEALKATIAWTDPAGLQQSPNVVDQQTARLRNDLDLRIYPPGTPANELTNPNSSFAVKPWILNPDLNGKSAALRAAAAVKGDDTRNNLEQVVVENPVASGVYTIRVTHKGSSLYLGTPQWVSLGISGRVVPTSHNFAITAFYPASGGYVVEWNSIPGGIYAVEGSSNLSTWINLTGDLSSRTDSMQAAVTAPGPSYFYRVRRKY
jgi:hypothetical protein